MRTSLHSTHALAAFTIAAASLLGCGSSGATLSSGSSTSGNGSSGAAAGSSTGDTGGGAGATTGSGTSSGAAATGSGGGAGATTGTGSGSSSGSGTTGTGSAGAPSGASSGGAEAGSTGSSGGSGGSGTGSSGGSGAGADAGPPVAYSDVWAILSIKCAGCHAAGHTGVTNGKLDMATKAAAYTNLVGVMAMGTKCGTSMEVRVVAGDSKTSLLYNKITEAKPDCGERMPDDNPALTDAAIAVIKAWIDQGALDN
jgi:hypothetical protein